MFDTIFGLPVHALVVHAVVILVPLAAFGAAVIAVVPRWRARFGVVVLAIATAGLVAVPVATRSGERLEERLNAGGKVAEQIQDHSQMGERVIFPTAALWLLTVVLVLLDRRRRTGTATTVVAVLVVIAALAAAALVAITGHLGTTAVWKCTIDSSACQ